MKNIKSFTAFVNEMYMGPADGAKSVADFNKKQKSLGYYPDAVSSEVGGPGNPGEVAEDETPTPLSQRLGNIEPDVDSYPSAGGQDFTITQPGSGVVSSNNMRGEPILTNIRR